MVYIIFSCALSWSAKGKAKEVQLTLGVREEDVCVGHYSF